MIQATFRNVGTTERLNSLTSHPSFLSSNNRFRGLTLNSIFLLSYLLRGAKVPLQNSSFCCHLYWEVQRFHFKIHPSAVISTESCKGSTSKFILLLSSLPRGAKVPLQNSSFCCHLYWEVQRFHFRIHPSAVISTERCKGSTSKFILLLSSLLRGAKVQRKVLYRDFTLLNFMQPWNLTAVLHLEVRKQVMTVQIAFSFTQKYALHVSTDIVILSLVETGTTNYYSNHRTPK